ncbi:hypothetical protein MTQ13_10055 [Streptomyces sp. XM4011]|uniref:hypothetical protein n=1 Tax=Streptomyces sp. XM4011 TaxID=2929780 RepID=UPI001FF71F7F|nr:hypothetical protein [Streptomyces sp. XM4011]MCK1814615.1 hypothetical protein [Streptomyces sp. XM4011]
MADLMDLLPFKSLVTQASAVLLTHGVEVESTAVQGVAAHLVEKAALYAGMDVEEAVHLVTPEAVAEIIMKATEDNEGASGPHAVRPVRLDDRMAGVPVESVGHLVMAASRAGKYAAANDDGATVSHLLDLATELGSALVRHHTDGIAEIPVGVRDEVADLVTSVADHVETLGWSICPCGEAHGQDKVDAGTAQVMQAHASLARSLREQATG